MRFKNCERTKPPRIQSKMTVQRSQQIFGRFEEVCENYSLVKPHRTKGKCNEILYKSLNWLHVQY